MRSRLVGLLTLPCFLALALVIAIPTAPAHADAGGTMIHVDLVLRPDGGLEVTERIEVPANHDGLHRELPLRVPDGSGLVRVHTVEDLVVDGAGEAAVDGAVLTTAAPAGQTELRYTLSGAVADGAGEQLLTWHPTGWWDAEVESVTLSFLAPTPSVSIIGCLAGAPGSSARCTQAAIGHEGILQAEHRGLGAEQRLELRAGLPEDTVSATAVWEEEPGLARALSLTGPVLAAFGLLGVLILAAVLLVAAARRRDLRALGAGSACDVILHDGDRVDFAAPHGALPGHAGTVITASVDPVDLAATTIDLAVRRYLHLEELPGEDGTLEWRLTRANGPDERLTPHERALLDGLVPGQEPVDLASLGEDGALDLDAVRAATYGEVIAQGWFADRGGRGPLTWLGGGLVAAGAAAGVILGLTIGHALVGLAIMGAGAVALLAPRFLPLRTEMGGRAAGDLLAMRARLHGLDPESVPLQERELLFSRALPYAVVLGESREWLGRFADLAPSDDGSAGISWFGGFEECEDLRRFSKHFPHFLAELEGVFAAHDHRASLGELRES